MSLVKNSWPVIIFGYYFETNNIQTNARNQNNLSVGFSLKRVLSFGEDISLSKVLLLMYFGF